MDWTATAAFVGVCVAAVGYVVKHRSDLQLAQRNDRLERINRQLSEFMARCSPSRDRAMSRGKRSGSDTGREKGRIGRAIPHPPGKTSLPGDSG